MAKKSAAASAPTEQALLSAVLAKPDDDAPRLAYARWLAANGQAERAEFIRLQIERARLPRNDRARIYHSKRERELLAAHGERWLAPLPEIARRRMTFERGFPGHAKPEIFEFLEWDDSIWQVAPVTSLWLGDTWLHGGMYREGLDKPREVKALAAKPQLAHIRRLDTTENGYFVLADLEIFLTTPYLSKLRELAICDVGLGPPRWGAVGDGVVDAVIGARDLTGVTTLSLEANNISEKGVAALLASRLMPQLTELCLGNNAIGDAGAERLASSPRVAKLDYLHIYCNDITDRGAEALAASPHLRRVKEISMMGNNLSEKGQAILRKRFGDRGTLAL